ncbi:MAG: hypothetical protein HFJ18_00805 [Clostridia bacterium]|nr:hypothetical protein [Clostridia bacterium]
MEESWINNIELDEIYNLIEVTKEELKNNNLKYKNLKENFYKILNEFPNLQLIFEEQIELNLTKTESKMLQKLVSIYMQISNIEEKEIFILGGKEMYIYLKELGLIKA